MMSDIHDDYKKELQEEYDKKLKDSYKNNKMIELKDELLKEHDGISAAVGMRSLCPVIEVVIAKPDNWTSMNCLEKKIFIVGEFVALDLIKIEVQGYSSAS